MMPAEIKNYDDVKENENVKSNDDLQKLLKEIDDIKDTTSTDDDKVVNVLKDGEIKEGSPDSTPSKILEQGLSNALLNCDKKILDIIVKEVTKLNSINPGVEGLSDLSRLLIELKNHRETVTQNLNSFNKFKSIIENKNKDGTNTLNKLNSLSSKEMEDVLNFVINEDNKSQVFNLYYMMKNIEAPDNFKRTDRKNFDEVLSKIESTYPELKEKGTDVIKGAQLSELFPENRLNAHDLRQILVMHNVDGDDFVWNGNNIGEDFKFQNINSGENIKGTDFIQKFNEYNGNRIRSVKEKGDELISNFDISGLSINNDKILKDGQILGYKEFLEGAGVNESDKFEKGFNVLSFDELTKPHFKEIMDAWESALKNRIPLPEAQDAPAGTGFDKVENIIDGLNIGEINIYVNSKIGENKDILHAVDEGGYECNINNVKEFLGKISSGGITFDKNFISVGTDSRKAWLASVQLLFNNKFSSGLKVDGAYARGGETHKAVKKFQEDYNRENAGTKLVVDGIPGPETLKALLGDTSETVDNQGEKKSPVPEFVNQFGLTKVDNLESPSDLGIPEGVTDVYQKDGEYYYLDNGVVTKFNKDFPYFKSKFNSETNKWDSRLDLNDVLGNKLNTIIKHIDDSAKITLIDTGSGVDNNENGYFLEYNGYRIRLDIGEIGNRDLCGKSSLEDKLKVSLFSISVLKKVEDSNENYNNLVYVSGRGCVIRGDRGYENLIIPQEDLSNKLIDDSNGEEFVNYIKTLKKPYKTIDQ